MMEYLCNLKQESSQILIVSKNTINSKIEGPDGYPSGRRVMFFRPPTLWWLLEQVTF